MSDEESLKTRKAADPRRAAYRASRDAEARVLLLIDGFSRKRTGPRTLEGRVESAKLDFLLRYPSTSLPFWSREVFVMRSETNSIFKTARWSHG